MRLGRLSLFAAPMLAAAAFLSAPAHAGTVYVNSYAVPYNINVSSSGPGFSEYSGAGQIVFQASHSASGPFSSFAVWCVDLFDFLHTPATFTEGSLTSNGNGVTLSAAQISHVAALIQHGDAMISGAEAVTAGYSKSQASAAIQIAIWSVENGSSYTFTSDDGALNGPTGLVAQYVDNVTGSSPVWAALPFSTVKTLESPGNQTQGYSAVPEPATLTVLGAGLVGLVALRRRNRT